MKNTEAAILKWMRKQLSSARSILNRSGKRNLAGKLKIRQDKKNDVLAYELVAPDYSVFVDKGRKNGKMPPLESIRKWCEGRNISSEAAFPIAAAIGRRGIKPTNFTSPFKQKVVTKEVERAAAKDVAKEIADAVKKN